MGVRRVDVSAVKHWLKSGRPEPVINCFLSFLNGNFFFLPWLLASLSGLQIYDASESTSQINNSVSGKGQRVSTHRNITPEMCYTEQTSQGLPLRQM